MIISSHNKKILRNSNKTYERECNCRIKENCPLEGKCLSKNIVYRAIVTPEENNKKIKEESYVGLTATKFKERLANHKAGEKHREKAKACKLSQHLWKLKDKNIKYKIEWKIVCRATPFSVSTGICNLCINEKVTILYRPEICTLNERNELTSNCRRKSSNLIDKG